MKETPEKPKLCIDCEHYRRLGHTCALASIEYLDVVTGNMRFKEIISGYTERAEGRPCGPEARFFTPKATP